MPRLILEVVAALVVAFIAYDCGLTAGVEAYAEGFACTPSEGEVIAFRAVTADNTLVCAYVPHFKGIKVRIEARKKT